MKQSLLAAALMAAALPVAAADNPLTGNLTLTTDYKFRGFTQTNYKAALQGGLDYALPGGFYVGNWNSSVEQSLYGGASLESDVYGGYKGKMGGLDLDVGAIHYMYPGSTMSGGPKIENTEVYFGVTAGPVAAKLYYAVSDYFSFGKLMGGPKTDGTIYLDLSANQDLGGGWALNAHVGVLRLKEAAAYKLPTNVTDYKIGVSKDFSGWVLGLAYVGTNDKDFFTTGVMTGMPARSAGDAKAMLSVTKTF
jgi:uncharacterized protein (TIGR02001 family)